MYTFADLKKIDGRTEKGKISYTKTELLKIHCHE